MLCRIEDFDHAQGYRRSIFTVTHLYNNVPALNARLIFAVGAWLYLFSLEAELRCSNQPMSPHSTYIRIFVHN